jgi:hypothetical protein
MWQRRCERDSKRMLVEMRRTWRLGVVLFLPAKQSFNVFNPAEHENDHRPERADDEHAFEKSHQNRQEYITHRELCRFKQNR